MCRTRRGRNELTDNNDSDVVAECCRVTAEVRSTAEMTPVNTTWLASCRGVSLARFAARVDAKRENRLCSHERAATSTGFDQETNRCCERRVTMTTCH